MSHTQRRTVRTLTPLVLLWMVAVTTIPSGQAPAPATAPAARAAAPAARATATQADTGEAKFLAQYCITCHNERSKKAFGNLALDSLNLADVGSHAETWEKVVRKVKTGMMPPSGAPRPERKLLDGFAAAIEARLDKSASPTAHLSTPGLHRLNRIEYANAVRDLLDLEVNVATLLPGDASSEGFDNIAEALSVSPALIQGYVGAAMKISRLAVGDRSMGPSQTIYAAPPALSQDMHIDGLPLGTRGGMLVTHVFPLDAEYEFSFGGGGGGGGFGGGGGGAAQVDFTIDGEKQTVTGRQFRLKVPAGPHRIGVAMVDRRRAAGVDDVYSDFRAAGPPTVGGGVNSININGPFNATGVGDTPSRRRIFICTPTSAADETTCARRILSTITRRAYRGPVATGDITTLMNFFAQGRKAGDFESGIQQAIARVLISPKFIYRVEEEPVRLAADGTYRISDIDLASRLSFLIWSSIPDDQLLDVAASGKLREPAVLQQQVRRMIQDRRGEALVKNFAGQWLFLRELATLQTDAKNFDDNLRSGFRRETEMLFDTIVREDRSIVEMLDADYTFVDERLARHYGMPNVRGSHFRKVMLPPDSPRRGLLGQGSVLTVTSTATRTSPVMRGKWILENLLGAPPPEPPPGVETDLGEGTEEAKVTSVRQRLEAHRKNPVCASCHKIMDPLGFSLENFDLVGTWRDVDGIHKIDAGGQLADGTPVSGPADLRAAVLSRSDAFLTTVTTKLLTYALGRPAHHYDMPTVRAIARRAARENNRFSAILMGIIESDSFQKRVRKPADAGHTLAEGGKGNTLTAGGAGSAAASASSRTTSRNN
jgi:mono/diheme cytochrome c family protein